MLYLDNSFDTLVILFTYMFIYNLSLLLVFWTLQQFVSFGLKTLYSFSDLKFNFYFVVSLTVTLLSMAGVPPFLGFFSKIFILLALLNSNFSIFYVFFFCLLFLGLYFYVQNIRFLHSANYGKISYSFSSNIRISSLYFYSTYTILFLLVFGFVYIDDVLLYFYWMLS